MNRTISRRVPGARALEALTSARRLTRGVPLVAVLLVLVGAAPASAAVTVGSGSLNASGSGQVQCDAAPCVLIQDKINGAVISPPAGVITSWSVRNATGTIALRVLRQRGSLIAGELHATNVSEGADETASGDVVQSFAARQSVKAGDYFGITLQSTSRVGAFAGDGNDDMFEVPGNLGLVNVDGMAADQFEQLVQVQVEPDADADGYGDETQDGCPTNASTNGACPEPARPAPAGPAAPTPQPDPFAAVRKAGPRMTLSPRSLRAGKDGSLRLAVKNDAGVAVKGKVSLSSTAAKLAGRKGVSVGSKLFSVAANGGATVTIKLSKMARRALRRHKRLAVTATTTAKAAQGKRSTRTTKLTVGRYRRARKAPPKATPKGRNGSYQGCFSDRTYGENPDLPCGGGNYAVRFEVVNDVVQRFRVLAVYAECNRGPGTTGPFDPVATAPLDAAGSFFSRSQRVGSAQELEDFFEYQGTVNENGTAVGSLKRYHAWYQRGGDDFCSSGTRPWTASQQ